MACAIFFRDPVPYAEGLRIQEALHEARRNDRIPDTVLLLQHRPVITLGRRGRTQHLLARESELNRRGIDLFEASRGGDVTYHGPGQVVMYPIIRLGRGGSDSHRYLNQLEEIAIRVCAGYGVEAWRREGKSGAWTAQGKIAAIGFKLQRWVTLHGMSFNVEQELAGFNLIVPCGLAGEPIASLRGLLGAAGPSPDDVARAMARQFEAVRSVTLEAYTYEESLPDTLRDIL
ncbi:MAG TPA: lipoyl(octanoyl) transferase LipB [Kiritimatiellia bacterium]|nr:lipoyl(octanoyl) transferase LipB [Kiritimatiellia bacterium]HMO97622.1 lipoyl(octanoyl) transferase LipB [Kiritimatiellia bacterium]HMP95982.1 lipoyl(octanoyl) transferase LipB [Kiritimatiellia bacterium]